MRNKSPYTTATTEENVLERIIAYRQNIYSGYVLDNRKELLEDGEYITLYEWLGMTFDEIAKWELQGKIPYGKLPAS